MKPVIGISGDVKGEPEPLVRIKLSYLDALRRAGAIPVVFAAGEPDEVPALLERVDGVVLSGGDDIDVRAFGLALHEKSELMHARRQAFEYALARALLERDIPTLGICLGMQMLGFAAGAELHQHLPDAGYAGLLEHRGLHEVEIERDSKLAAILGTARASVVSSHHQALARVPEPFRRAASSADGVIEAIEAPGKRFLVAVQWHPERSPDAADTERLFRALVDAAR